MGICIPSSPKTTDAGESDGAGEQSTHVSSIEDVTVKRKRAKSVREIENIWKAKKVKFLEDFPFDSKVAMEMQMRAGRVSVAGLGAPAMPSSTSEEGVEKEKLNQLRLVTRHTSLGKSDKILRNLHTGSMVAKLEVAIESHNKKKWGGGFSGLGDALVPS